MDGQTIGVALGILGGIAAALGAYLKSQGNVKVQDAETRAMRAEGELKQMQLEHDARIKELDADTDMRDLLREQIVLSEKQRQAQQDINEQQRKTNQEQFENFMRALEAQRKDTDAGYRLIRNVQNDANIQIANVNNTVRDGFSRVNAKLDTVLLKLPIALNGKQAPNEPPPEPPIPTG